MIIITLFQEGKTFFSYPSREQIWSHLIFRPKALDKKKWKSAKFCYLIQS